RHNSMASHAQLLLELPTIDIGCRVTSTNSPSGIVRSAPIRKQGKKPNQRRGELHGWLAVRPGSSDRRNRTVDLLIITNCLQEPTESNQEEPTPPEDEDSE